ncbi:MULTISPECIES: OmpH family outer membrane protein [unclassified Sphingomonas]|uniref:OmpH family outer membrane protein n=1 Tax=unclassified Sphingomonas TaxID=196159 RepID=UPI0026D7AF6C
MITKMLRALALALAAALVTSPLTAQTLPTPVIAIVDLDEVITNSIAGKQAQADLKKRVDALQTRVNTLRTSFGSEEQSLLKTRPTATGPAATAWEIKARDIQARKAQAEQQLAGQSQRNDAARRDVVRQLNDAATPIITAVMRERGASITLAKGATLQYLPALDITKEVIARLDRSLPRITLKP